MDIGATGFCHMHATGNPEEGVCCLCDSPDGLGCRVMTTEGNAVRRRDHHARMAAQVAELPPPDPADPWGTDPAGHVDDNDLDGRGIRGAFGV